jgi:hypothetical protein
MTWTKLGDEFADDADTARLSDAAVRTHIDALVWSNRRLLDGRIPKKDLPRFAFSLDAEAAMKELETAGWWNDDGDAWELAHHPEWQQSRKTVEQLREEARERQERSRRHKRGDHSMCIRGRFCPDGAVTPVTRDKPSAERAQDPASLSRDVTRDQRRESHQPDPTRPVPKDKGRGGDGAVNGDADPEDEEPAPPAAETLRQMRRQLGVERCEHHPQKYLDAEGHCPFTTCPTNAEPGPSLNPSPDEPPY